MAPPPTQPNLVPHFSHIGTLHTESTPTQGIVHAPGLQQSPEIPFAWCQPMVPAGIPAPLGMPRNEASSSTDAVAPRSPPGLPGDEASTMARRFRGRGLSRWREASLGPRSAQRVCTEEASLDEAITMARPCAYPSPRSAWPVCMEEASVDEASTLARRNSQGAPKDEASTLPLRSALGLLPTVDRKGLSVAQSESTKEGYSPPTEDKTRRDNEDDRPGSRRSIESSTKREGDAGHFSVPSPHSPRRSLRSEQLGLKVQTGSDLPTVRGKMPAAPLELLETEEPIRPPFTGVPSLSYSSPPTLIQAHHKAEVSSSGSLPLAASTVPQGNWTRQEGNRSPIRQGAPIETGLVEALRSLQVQPNFREIVSTTNNWGQTLAHLSIFYDYPYLLSSLVDWRIDLTIADANGFTALHYAYMKGDLDSVRILRRGGASEVVVDKLGRTPLDLLPEGSGSVFDLDNDTKVTVGFDSRVSPLGSYSDEEVY